MGTYKERYINYAYFCKKKPSLIPWICLSLRVIFNEFLKVFKWVFEKVESDNFSKFCYFELEFKNLILILWSSDLFDILFEFKWWYFLSYNKVGKAKCIARREHAQEHTYV